MLTSGSSNRQQKLPQVVPKSQRLAGYKKTRLKEFLNVHTQYGAVAVSNLK